MDRQERENLRQLAKKAPQGLWVSGCSREGQNIYAVVEPADWREKDNIATCGVYDAQKARSVELAKKNKNANYIAAARPERILELLDMLDRYDEAVAQKCTDCPGKRAGMCEGCALQEVSNGNFQRAVEGD